MKNHALRTPLRVLLVLLLLSSSAAAFWSGLYALAFWNDLWSGLSYQDSESCADYMYEYCRNISVVLELEREDAQHGLTYGQTQELQRLRESLLASRTNFRYQVHDSAGNLLMSNLDGAGLEESVTTVHGYSSQLSSDYSVEDDYFLQGSSAEVLAVAAPDGSILLYDPGSMTPDELQDAEQYGWLWLPDENASADEASPAVWAGGGCWVRTGDDVRDEGDLSYTIEFGLPAVLTVDDDFRARSDSYSGMVLLARRLVPVFALCLVLSAVLLFQLLRSAGRRPDGSRVVLRSRDKLWYELYLAAGFAVICLTICLGDSITYASNLNALSWEAILTLAVFSFLVAWIVYELLETAAVRLKARMFWRTTLCGLLWSWIRRAWASLSAALAQLPLFGRAVGLFLLYLLGTLLTGMTIILIPFYQGAVLYAICRWIKQWRIICAAADQAAAGGLDCQIDTKGMYPDLRQHAEQLNNLSGGLNKAVNERMKSEHFKSELITNVSHDLKTPLTSIINYVDLLKKTDIQDPVALEYIDVLDRKSQRLKKLTEDLVEASKASTGALTVNRERLNVGQLADQALAEYADRLASSGLTPVMTVPEEGAYISADGRHLWRVIDNLLSNCCKYALPGTRVYLDVVRWDGQVLLSVKNISRDPLNIPAELLMERFIRGDTSRTTEGSGLGLSIARSLTELQGGSFRLSIDGDLFKASVSFPEAPPPAPAALNLEVVQP